MIRLDLKSDIPIYEQIIEQIKYHVMKGNMEAGTAIPSVRKLALVLQITPGTVAKAYQELERQGIIETVRGKGTFIAGEIKRKPDEERLASVKKTFLSGMLELKMMGYGEEDIVKMVQSIYEEMER